MATDCNFQTVGDGMLLLLLQSVTNGCMHVLTTAPSPLPTGMLLLLQSATNGCMHVLTTAPSPLPTGMLLLLQSVTGDGWTLLLQDSLVQEESGLCTEGVDCGSWVAIPYFVTFQLFGTLVFLNLMVAVILENFTSLSEQVRG